MAVDLEGNSKKLRTRSPAYPYLDLRSALDKAATLWKAEGRHPAAVNVVMHHWGYKEESSTGYSCMAALKKYGLIEHDGVGESKQIRLSNLAMTILLDETADSPQRTEALRTAAMGPRIHAGTMGTLRVRPALRSIAQALPGPGKKFQRGRRGRIARGIQADHQLCRVEPRVRAGGFQLGVCSRRDRADPGSQFRRAEPLCARASLAGTGRIALQLATGSRPPAFQPPPRAIGPAGGARREPDAFSAPGRNANGREGGHAPPPAANGGSSERRREASGYFPGGRQQQPVEREREPMRYDQDDFGYEEDRHAASPRENGSPSPVGGPQGRFAPRAASAPVQVTAPAPAPALSAAASVAGPVGNAEVAEVIGGFPRKELPVPLDGDRVALVPYPMTEEDFTLLIATLQLWKKRLVRVRE